MRKTIFSIVIASTALAAAPASAQLWGLQPSVQRQIASDINQLDNRIARAAQRRAVSAREAAGLRRDASDLKRLYYGYGRNGLTRREVAALEGRVNSLHQRLRLERRDWDGRRG